MSSSPSALPELEFAERGSGPTFTMLHPGGTDARALESLIDIFSERFRVLAPDRRGHGRTPDTDGPMSFESMADDTIAFLERTRVQQAATTTPDSDAPAPNSHSPALSSPISALSSPTSALGSPIAAPGSPTPAPLLGYSDGAVVALMVALRRPDLLTHLVFVSGVFSRDGWPAETLDAEVPDFMVDAYAEVSPDGRDHYAVVTEKLRQMHADGPTLTVQDLATVRVPVLVIVGDDDDMPLEHVLELYRALPFGELAVVPHASHGVLVEKPDLCAQLITDFLRPDKPATFAPVRRAERE